MTRQPYTQSFSERYLRSKKMKGDTKAVKPTRKICITITTNYFEFSKKGFQAKFEKEKSYSGKKNQSRLLVIVILNNHYFPPHYARKTRTQKF
jgi:hypothetical protein